MALPRRVITGFDASGKSIFISDGQPKVPTHYYETHKTPADLSIDEEPEAPTPVDPPFGGTRFRVVELQPLPPEKRHLPTDWSDKSGMHATQSIDFATVLSGEVNLVLDDSEVVLKQGDCVIQRGTMHAWRNRGDVPCVLFVVLVSAINEHYPVSH